MKHIHIERSTTDGLWCWRLYMVRRDSSFWPLLDFTLTRLFRDRPSYWRVRLGRLTVIEVNRCFSGLPTKNPPPTR